MSVKIYKGLIMPNTTLLELNQFFMEVREDAKRAAMMSYLRTAVRIAIHQFDRKSVGLSVDRCGSSLLSAAFEKLSSRHEEIKKTGYRDPAADFDFEVSILPTATGTLLIPFCENPLILETLTRRKCVKEYGYWSGADQPDGISDKEWKARAHHWGTALGDFDSPSMRGLSATIIDTDRIETDVRFDEEFISKNFGQCQLPFESRLSEVANEYCMNQLVQKRIAEKGEFNSTDLMEEYYGFQSYLRSKEGREMIKFEGERVELMMTKSITLELLRKKIEP